MIHIRFNHLFWWSIRILKFWIGYRLQPCDLHFIFKIGNCNMRHRRISCSAMPMLRIFRNINHVASLNCLRRFSFFLIKPRSFCYNQHLALRMGMPVCSCAFFKSDGTGRKSVVFIFDQSSDFKYEWGFIRRNCLAKLCWRRLFWLFQSNADYSQWYQ